MTNLTQEQMCSLPIPLADILESKREQVMEKLVGNAVEGTVRASTCRTL